ncbi:MAG: DedA family protein [Marmoricola sp.]
MRGPYEALDDGRMKVVWRTPAADSPVRFRSRDQATLETMDGLLNINPVWLIVVCTLLVFAEDAIFVGFVIPGETAAVLAGVATIIHGVPLWVPIVTVVIAAILGDTVGYELGKHYLIRVLETKSLQRHRAAVDKASDFLRRRGGVAVFLGRFTAFFRAMMPALAGSARMPYARFLRWNAVGGVIWGTTFVVVGHVAGRSYHTLEHKIGLGGAIAVAAVVVVLLAAWRVRSSIVERREERRFASSHDSTGT